MVFAHSPGRGRGHAGTEPLPGANEIEVKLSSRSIRVTVVESGTGRRIVASTLEGKGAEFAEGESVVFQTRVIGGARGETIRHVWIFDGRAQQSITLRLGSPDWRTYSKKTLYKRGPWRVEARDPRGTVLASASFTCTPAGAR